jgi:hypothetical protein
MCYIAANSDRISSLHPVCRPSSFLEWPGECLWVSQPWCVLLRLLHLALICMPYVYALYVCLICMPYVYALCVCLMCMPYVYALWVSHPWCVLLRLLHLALICMPYVYALCVCLMCMLCGSLSLGVCFFASYT